MFDAGVPNWKYKQIEHRNVAFTSVTFPNIGIWAIEHVVRVLLSHTYDREFNFWMELELVS